MGCSTRPVDISVVLMSDERFGGLDVLDSSTLCQGTPLETASPSGILEAEATFPSLDDHRSVVFDSRHVKVCPLRVKVKHRDA